MALGSLGKWIPPPEVLRELKVIRGTWEDLQCSNVLGKLKVAEVLGELNRES